MFAILRLLRAPNLLLVGLTQWLVHAGVVVPALERNGLSPLLGTPELAILIGACLCVTGGGYVINDLLDREIDAINRPGQNVVERFGPGLCRYLYFGLLLLGYVLSLGLALWLGRTHLLWLYPLATLFLALYSRYLKTIPFVGNVVVAILCAGVPLLLALAEWEGLATLAEREPGPVRILFLYALFAFLGTLLRELVKDLQDLRGDRALGRLTLPVVLGTRGGKLIGLLLVVLNLAALIFSLNTTRWIATANGLTVWLWLLAGGLLVIGALLWRGRTPEAFGRLSGILKLFLVLGAGMLFFI